MTVFVPPDSRAAVANALRTLLDARPEPYAQGATVGTRLLGEYGAGAPALPYVMVASDGLAPVHWPAAATDLVRITVWHSTEDMAFDLAGLALGLLADHRGGVLRGLRPAGPLLPARDEDTQTPMCSTLLTAALRPVPAT